jgi:tripartite-type tricarboxylate transporter receptor subunit TctC
MNTMRRHFSLAALALLSLPALSQPAWPDKPVRLVVPYTPGGGTDTVTRHIANAMTQDEKWAFVIDNKPGGSGNIGLDVVAKSRADGYTLGMGQTSNLAINPALGKMPFDPAKDVVPLALVAEQPMLMVVRAESPWKTLADGIKAARERPGEVKQALAGSGTVGHLAGEMMARSAGIKVLNVPYKGAAPALTDLLGGQTDYMFATPQAVVGMVKGGKLRVLAVTSARRMAILPDVPTVAESGYKDFEAVEWKVIVAPAGTPADVIRRINAAVARGLTQPAVLTQLAAEGSAPMSGTPDQAARYLAQEQAKWGKLIRDAGIKPE